MTLLTNQEILAELHKLSPTSFALERYNVLCKAQALKMWTELKEKYGGWYDGSDYCIEIPKDEYNQIEEELKQ